MPRQPVSADRRNASVGKAAALLRAAAAHPDGASVSQLARDANIPRATALRMLEALEAERLITRLRDRDVVLLGDGLYELTAAGDADRPLIEAARRPMRELADATGEAITLAVRRGNHIMGIDEIPGEHVIGPSSWIGRSWGLSGTSSGRLATGAVAADSVAESVDEIEPGLASIAAAIPYPGRNGAYVTVSGPTYRFDAAARAAAAPQLLNAVRRIAGSTHSEKEQDVRVDRLGRERDANRLP